MRRERGPKQETSLTYTVTQAHKPARFIWGVGQPTYYRGSKVTIRDRSFIPTVENYSALEKEFVFTGRNCIRPSTARSTDPHVRNTTTATEVRGRWEREADGRGF